MRKKGLKNNFPDAEYYTLKHATRINGVVDVWHNGKTIYCIPDNEYRDFEDRELKYDYIEKCIDEHEKRNPIKKLKTGNMSMQEFRNNQLQKRGDKTF